MLDAVPAEVKACPQWLLWRKVYNEKRAKYDKIPLSPHSGLPADVTASTSWGSFDLACSQFALHKDKHSLSGLGFVLGYDSGVVGIDIDNLLMTDGSVANPELYESARAFNSYTELSPSRTGLHILVKALLDGGRRGKGIEVYGTGRFFTVTGMSYGPPLPLAIRQTMVENLIGTIEVGRASRGGDPLDWTTPQKLTDDALLSMARTADNAEKFVALFEARYESYYPSWSEADQALINILAFYTDAPAQVVRLFRSSALGNREKAGRIDYVSNMVTLAFDRKVPLVQPLDQPIIVVDKKTPSHPAYLEPPDIFSGDEGEDAEERAARADNAFQPPTGFVREVADWFYSQSIYPMAEVAIAGALGLMAGLCGRQYQFQKQGLNLYMLVLAETGSGKDALGIGMSRIFNAVCNPLPLYASSDAVLPGGFPAARSFEGPSKLTGKGLVRQFQDSDSLSMVSVLPEFSQTMSGLGDPRANEGMKDFLHVLLEFYTKSAEGAAFGGSRNADKTKDIKQIASPAFTMVCEGTPGRFYAALNETMVTDGLIARFIVVEKTGYEEFNPHHAQHAIVPDSIKIGVSELAQQIFTMKQNGDARINVGMTPDAETLNEQMRLYYRNRGISGTNEVHKYLWLRAHQNLTRIAALLAIGCDRHQPTITVEQLRWANRIIYRQCMLIVGKFKRGEVGQGQLEDNEQYKMLISLVQKWRKCSEKQLSVTQPRWAEAWRTGLVPHAYLLAQANTKGMFRVDRRGAGTALRLVIDTAVRSGLLERVRMDGANGDFYRPHL